MSDFRKRTINPKSQGPVSAPSSIPSTQPGSESANYKKNKKSFSFFSFVIKLFVILFLILVFLVILIVTALIIQNGGPGGKDFPNRSSAKVLMNSSSLEKVALLPVPPGNLAVAENGKIFFSFHPEYNYHIKVALLTISFDDQSKIVNGPELYPSNQFVPYPNEEYQNKLSTVLPLRIHKEKLFFIDFAHFALFTPKLHCFDFNKDQLLYVYDFPSSVCGLGCFLNDFHISLDGNFLFIADTSLFANQPALIIFDEKNKNSRRLLSNHPSMRFQHFTPKINDIGVRVLGLFVIRPSVDTIALSRDSLTLYYAPVAHEHLFSIQTKFLIDPQYSDEQLSSFVTIVANKTISDGATTDIDNFIYLTDFEHSSISVIDLKSSVRESVDLVRSKELLRWPDGLSFGPHNYLYITCSALHLKWLNEDMSPTGPHAPFHILRIKINPKRNIQGSAQTLTTPAGQ